ncbi:MAG: complex I subunit 1 family protein [Bacteroidota bacterium]
MSTLFFYLPMLLLFSLVAVYTERKVAAFVQDRIGPMEVGYQGLLQTVADLLKLLQKEAIVPAAADKVLFVWAPVWMLTTVLAAFAVLPVTNAWAGAGTAAGVLYLLTFTSLKTLGIVVAGWASNNKYARLGSMRAATQMVAYEIPLGLSILCVIVVCQTLDLQIISAQQGPGLWAWNVFRVPPLLLVYPIFFIAALAACQRAPFDLAESESELIGGYHTEYGGIRWAWIMLTEYSMVLLMSLLGAILFWGSWNTPFFDVGPCPLGTWTSGAAGTLAGHLWAGFWLLSKALITVAIKMWIRWTFPRIQFDQLMCLCWQYLTPAVLTLLLLVLGWCAWRLP